MVDYFQGQVDPLKNIGAGQAYVENLYNTQAQKQAGAQFAQGDFSGASNVLAQRGQLDQAANVTKYGRDESAMKAGFLANAARAIAQIPESPGDMHGDPNTPRAQATLHIVPTLKMWGLDDQTINSVLTHPKDNASLTAFLTSLGQGPQLQKVGAGETVGYVSPLGPGATSGVAPAAAPQPAAAPAPAGQGGPPAAGAALSPGAPAITPQAIPGPAGGGQTPALATLPNGTSASGFTPVATGKPLPPPGYSWNPDGTMTAVSGGPGDPSLIGKQEGAKAGAQAGYDLVKVDLKDGSTVQLPRDVAARLVLSGELPGLGHSATPGDIASQQESARAANDVITVQRADGSTVQMSRAQFLGGGGQGAGGAPGAPASGGAPGLGVSQTPAAKTYADSQAKAASDLINTAAGGREQILQTKVNADQGLTFALSHDTNAFTGGKAQVATILQAMGVPGADRFANDVASYKQLLNGETKDFIKLFPSRFTDRDMKVVQGMIPALTTPKDAAVFYFAMKQAKADRSLAYTDFLTNYDGPKDPQAINRAWNQSPQARSSLFQDPVWQRFTLGGKPTVFLGPDGQGVEMNGKRYGVFRPGTPMQQTFEVAPGAY